MADDKRDRGAVSKQPKSISSLENYCPSERILSLSRPKFRKENHIRTGTIITLLRALDNLNNTLKLFNF